MAYLESDASLIPKADMCKKFSKLYFRQSFAKRVGKTV